MGVLMEMIFLNPNEKLHIIDPLDPHNALFALCGHKDHPESDSLSYPYVCWVEDQISIGTWCEECVNVAESMKSHSRLFTKR
jgi:hypothetical protein